MIKLAIEVPTTPEWAKWIADAKKGHGDLAKDWKEKGSFEVKESLYKRMKGTFFDLYYGKCAYCEAPLQVSGWDQLDHFRPKDAVLEKDRKPASINPKGDPHPGYYWLAYEWTNLVPSCAICNGYKGAVFPLVKGSLRATAKGKEIEERPVFIHPAFDREDPERHIGYEPSTGHLEGRTPRGWDCIDLLRLNKRDALIDARRQAYQACITLLSDVLTAIKKAPQTLPQDDLVQLRKFATGAAAFSLVGRRALRDCRQLLEEKVWI